MPEAARLLADYFDFARGVMTVTISDRLRMALPAGMFIERIRAAGPGRSSASVRASAPRANICSRPVFRFAATEHDPERPWIVLSQTTARSRSMMA